ncbi:MAG TPA: type II toxin-antitoxin system VapC family toxin [Thermomicrobiales bacterium]|nr:type II toxin-antitoxin system VapC family toxin [Thermomicrobiales bacterium]
MPEQLGWLDTNLFVHALFPRDPHYARCQRILAALDAGTAEGWLDPLVVHDLTYVLGRLPQFPDRAAIQGYLRTILLTEQIRADDKPALLAAVARWVMRGGGFTDAWLASLAGRRALPVCSVNARDLPDIANTFDQDDV